MPFSFPAYLLDEVQALPGEPADVTTAAHHYSHIADAIRDSASTLRALAASDIPSTSEAVAVFLKNAGDVAEKIDQVHDRYETMGSALTTYSRELADAQSLASKAVPARNQAIADMKRLDGQLDQHSSDLDKSTDPAEKTALQKKVSDTHDDIAAVDAAGKGAIRSWTQAQADRDAAAEKAQKAISQTVDNDDLNDSWKDNLGGAWHAFSAWVSEHADIIKAVTEILGDIATFCAIAAIFFPGFGIAALILGGLALVGDLMLASTGNGSWLDVGLDIVGLASFGVGRVLVKSAKGVTMVARGNRVSKLFTSTGTRYAGNFQKAQRAVDRSFANSVSKPLPRFSPYRVAAGGEKELALTIRAFDRTTLGAGVAGDKALTDSARTLVTVGTSLNYGSQGLDIGHKILVKSGMLDGADEAMTIDSWRVAAGSTR